MGAIDLGFLAVKETGLAGGPEIHSRVAAVVDFDLRPVFEVFEGTGRADEHGRVTRAADRSLGDFPLAGFTANSLPTIERLAIEEWLPFLRLQ